jgi:hypothetical protein
MNHPIYDVGPGGRRVRMILPGVGDLIKGLHGWDVEERTTRVVVTALDVIPGVPPSSRARPSDLVL